MQNHATSVKTKPQYHSVICAIARDEDPYIIEWIAYHLSIGFDHIFLYDNMSKRPIARHIADRYRRRVTVIEWLTVEGQDAQLEAYKNFLECYGADCTWTAVIDLDEMINLKKHNDIRDFLRDFPASTTVAINWRIFGSNGHTVQNDDFMMSRFTRASEINFSQNQHVKSIYRTKYIEKIGHHNGYYLAPHMISSPSHRLLTNEAAVPVDEADFEIAQINHYFVKSAAEWEAKLKRGYADGTVRPPGTYEMFDRNEIEDVSILRHFRKTRRLASRLPPDASRFRTLLRFLSRSA